ncbi:MAG TPA: FliM/FliN family flagellar motor switch protein [Rhodanobacteraceae bacterium]
MHEISQYAPDDVRPLDLTAPLHVVHGRLPAIDAIQDRLARQLRASLFQYMHYGVQIKQSETRFEAHDEVMRNFPQPSLVGIVSMQPLRGLGVMSVDGAMVGAVVDRLCGADSAPQATHNAEFSPLESRIARQMLDIVADAVGYAWKGIEDLEFVIARVERNASFIAIADPREQLIATRIRVGLATGEGNIVIAIPYSAVEPIRDRLSAAMTLSSLQGEDRAQWQRELLGALDRTEVPVRVEMARLRMSAADVQYLHAGQVIPIPRPRDVRAYSGDAPLFEGDFGVRDDVVVTRVRRFANRHLLSSESSHE